jgi:hypothetical protein
MTCNGTHSPGWSYGGRRFHRYLRVVNVPPQTPVSTVSCVSQDGAGVFCSGHNPAPRPTSRRTVPPPRADQAPPATASSVLRAFTAYVHTHSRTFTLTRTHARAPAHTHTHECLPARTCTRTHVPARTHSHAHTHVHVHTRTHALAPTRTPKHAHAPTHTHGRTHPHTHAPPGASQSKELPSPCLFFHSRASYRPRSCGGTIGRAIGDCPIM